MAIITVNVVISEVCHYLFHVCSANVAIGAIMSQFPSVDPYRWSAWFSAALITAFVAVFLTVYKEEWKCNQCKCRGSFTCGRGPLQSPWGLKNWLVSFTNLQFLWYINNVCIPSLVVHGCFACWC